MCNIADRKSNVPPMDQPLQILNFCRLDDIIVFDGQQILGSVSEYKWKMIRKNWNCEIYIITWYRKIE